MEATFAEKGEKMTKSQTFSVLISILLCIMTPGVKRYWYLLFIHMWNPLVDVFFFTLAQRIFLQRVL